MAEPVIPPEIKAQSTERLLRLFAELTHKIHRADEAMFPEKANEYRAQRDILKTEILVRCDRV